MEKSFEQVLKQLEDIVRELESGDIELNEAVKKYNEGMQLSKELHQHLKSAEEVIVKMMKDDELVDFDE